MSRRYFVDAPISGDSAQLTGPEAHHLLHVMRAKPGDEVVLFDGSGDEFPARIERLGRSEVALAVLERETVDRELPGQLTLAVALPKGDRQRWLVEKAVELGVSRLVPLETERSVAQPNAKALDRLRRAVIEASKQCGRNRLMDIVPAQPWSEFLATTDSAQRLIAHPTGGISSVDVPFSHTEPIVVAVGPEGGFSDAEVTAAMNHSWQAIVLGQRILRIETAALALAAAIVAQLERP